jgi:hypothetical protein
VICQDPKTTAFFQRIVTDYRNIEERQVQAVVQKATEELSDFYKPSPSPKATHGFRKAVRQAAKLRMAITGPAGSGKTASALLVAHGLCGDWEKIGLIDTEHSSGELYVNQKIGETTIGQYNVMVLEPPFHPQKYIEALKMAEEAGLEVVILDSLSHAWAGSGGILDIHLTATQAQKHPNSFTAWREVTPIQEKLIESILQSRIHVIATMRSKMSYILAEDGGKQAPKKVGLAPIQRDSTEYEFTVVMDLSIDHVATVTKDRTNLFGSENFKPTVETGQRLLTWLKGN